MHVLFESAVRWDLLDRNPISHVRVKGGTKRLKRPRILEPGEFSALVSYSPDPYRTMFLIAGCLGLRCSEIVGLQWSDFDFELGTLLIQRGIVHGRIGPAKTEASQECVPIDPVLAEALLLYRERCYPTAEAWLFANPVTGRPYHQEEIQKRYIRRAAAAAAIQGKVGWHTFRHSYRSWLDDVGASVAVQKELMRHASITTTTNLYGTVVSERKREANSNVVQMIVAMQESAVDQCRAG